MIVTCLSQILEGFFLACLLSSQHSPSLPTTSCPPCSSAFLLLFLDYKPTASVVQQPSPTLFARLHLATAPCPCLTSFWTRPSIVNGRIWMPTPWTPIPLAVSKQQPHPTIPPQVALCRVCLVLVTRIEMANSALAEMCVSALLL